MIFHKYIPKFPLSKYVESIIYVEGNNKGAGLPKTAMSLVFNLEDSFKLFENEDFAEYTHYKKHWVAGLQTKPSYVESFGKSRMIVVQFKTLGAYIFLGQPLHHFTDKYITLDCVFSREAEITWERLSESKTIEDKILITEEFLFNKFLKFKLSNEKLLTGIESTIGNQEKTSINFICKEFNISRKHLNFLFKEYSGVSPKMLSSLKRLQKTLQILSRSTPKKLTTFAYEANYFDQAHFINDFKKFTNLRPKEYVRSVETKPSIKLIPHFLPFS